MPGGAVRADALRAAWTAASKEEGSLEPFEGDFSCSTYFTLL